MDDGDDSGSPWPILVALGIVIGEFGVLFGIVPVAVGGVLLFGWGSAAIARDAGFAPSVWQPLAGVGAVVGGLALVVWSIRAPRLSPDAFLAAASTDAIAVRAAIVAVASVGLLLAGLSGMAAEWHRRDPGSSV